MRKSESQIQLQLNNNLINEYQSIFVKVLIDEALETQLAGLVPKIEADNSFYRTIDGCPPPEGLFFNVFR